MSEHPPPDPSRLLEYWNEWESGEVSPGQVMANLKRGGLREILEALATTAAADLAAATNADLVAPESSAP